MTGNEWDARYAGEAFAFGTEPNDFLRASVEGWTPGDALCLAEELAPRGVFVATVAIGVQVERNGTKCDPDRIAEVFWRLHEKQDEHDVIYA